ncbi:MAG: hypothetical protein ACOZNI_08535 [Myxococcota bacterium]
MPRTHDGISCRLPPRPLSVVVGVAMLGAGGWLGSQGRWGFAAGLLVVGTLVLLNQIGSRRVRVIHSKLLVEDEHLLTALLIGPTRDRVEWPHVKGFRIEKNALVLDTDGKPFVTAQGASPEDLEALKAAAETAWKKARAETGGA